MNKPPLHKRRPLLSALFITLVLITGLLVIFISQLDLDDYLQTIEEELSESLKQPVAIGRIELGFERGLALELRNLRIGDPHDPLVSVPRLTTTLKLKPLLDGKFVLDRVLLDNPSLQLRLPLQSRSENGFSQQRLDSFGIRILTIRNAELKIYRRKTEGARKLLQLDNLHSVLTGWGSGKTARLVITGQHSQQDHVSDFTIDLSLPVSTDPATWRQENFRSQLTLQNFATTGLPKPPWGRLPEKIDLTATLDGIPAEGAGLKARLLSQVDHEELFTLSGTWQSSSEQDAVTGLTGSLLGLPIDGEFFLMRQPGKNFFAGRVAVHNVALTPKLLAQWRIPAAEKLKQGTLRRLDLELEKSWNGNEQPQGLPRIGLEFALTDLAWEHPELRQLQEFSVELSLQKTSLRVKDGLASVGNHPVRFSGRIDTPFNQPRLDLDLRFEPDLKRLEEQLALPADWRLSGPVPVKLQLSGLLSEPSYLLQADLSKTSLELGRLLQKNPAHQGLLQLSGRIDKEHLQMDRFLFRLDEFDLSGAGNFPFKPQTDSLLLDFDAFELTDLYGLSPLLAQLRLVGQVHPYLEYTEAAGARGSVQVTELGNHFFNIVGDLNQARGEIHFNRQGLSFSDLQANLGASPVVLSGSMHSWQQPQLELEISGKKVRAEDLIFPNRQMWFYDLDGHLKIDKNGMAFAPVHVRLEDKTRATVTGQIENFQDPQTTLEISSDQADILDVIKVFQGPRKTRPKKEQRERKPLLISATAKRGTLGGLRFRNAEGMIKDHRGVLTIYPLNFASEEGHCVARVEFDRNREMGVLKVSGHAEDINASVLHQNIFRKRGLISGRLRGHFYLEGATANNRFWHNATGGIHLQVKNGTLRKFRGLARVFSLLNVSQIFAGKLPDMDKDGMPFTLIEGSVRVADGRMKTDNMHVVSEAMNLSLVGEQNLVEGTVNFNLGVMPLRTVDKVVSNIPIAGWVLAGDKKALITAHFKIEGPSEKPKVTVVPIDSVSDTVFGIVKRTFGLPGKLVKDIGELFRQPPAQSRETEAIQPEPNP